MDDSASELSEIWDREHDQYVLRQLMALAEPRFDSNTWKAFCRVALDGLQHAHQRGMVHRDIKPHNLMVTKDATVRFLISDSPHSRLNPRCSATRTMLAAT